MPEFTLPAPLAKARPTLGLVLGSGLGGFTDRLEDIFSCDYSSIGGLPASTLNRGAGCCSPTTSTWRGNRP